MLDDIPSESRAATLGNDYYVGAPLWGVDLCRAGAVRFLATLSVVGAAFVSGGRGNMSFSAPSLSGLLRLVRRLFSSFHGGTDACYATAFASYRAWALIRHS